MKKISGILLFLFTSVFANAQMTGTDALNTTVDSVYRKILIIPYNPIMHLSDADHDISEYTGKKTEEIRAMFRLGLTQQLNAKLLTVYETYAMLSGVSEETDKDLNMIYGSVNYRMDTVFPVSHPVKDTTKKSIFSKKNSSKVKEIHDLKYMNISMSHPELLPLLSQKYRSDLLVFLNQFEIKTNYDDCLDLALKIYRRQLKVHYSVFDPEGNQLYGDVAVVDFPSNTNDPKEIMQGNFQKISEYILKTLPKKKVN